MRLFIAVKLNEETKRAILTLQNSLKELSRGGNFTKEENLHITLVFIGETERGGERKIISALDAVDSLPFTLTFSGLGSFGNLYWMGINKCRELDDIYGRLCHELANKGFPAEKREFTPHITLVRQFVSPPGFNKINFASQAPVITQKVEKISLMRSERKYGSLVYTEIYEKSLRA